MQFNFVHNDKFLVTNPLPKEKKKSMNTPPRYPHFRPTPSYPLQVIRPPLQGICILHPPPTSKEKPIQHYSRPPRYQMD